MSYELSGIKWGSSTQGSSGGQVTWSFATTSSGDYYQFDAQISEAAYRELVRDAFDAWEAVADIDFVEASSGSDSDIKLGWDSIDGTSGTVAQAYQSYYLSSSGFDTYNFAEIRFDTSESWSTNKDYVGGNVNFYAVALHEIGHAIGLDHTSDSSTIMYAYTGGATDLTSSDIAGARAIYGAAEGGSVASGANSLVGTSGNDHLYGTAAGDVMIGHGGNDTIEGAGGNDTLWAGASDTGHDLSFGDGGNDTIGGGAGNDTLVGGSGADSLLGGTGGDLIYAGNQGSATSDGASVTNVAWGGSGNDRFHGDNTGDMLGGGSGADTVNGAGGADTIYGGRGDAASNGDNLSGDDGNDVIYGGNGNDRLYGDGGNDRLYGGSGADRIEGGAGFDDIWGGTGDDDLFGGTGSDLFGFVQGSGSDAIYGFNTSEEDRIDLSDYAGGFSSFAEIQARLANVTGGVTLSLDGGDSIFIEGLAVTDLAESDFLF